MEQSGSLVCLGLDPDWSRIPGHLRRSAEASGDRARAIVAFNEAILDAALPAVAAVKPNLGFYVAFGIEGIQALVETRRLIPDDVPTILDAKVNDIGHTASAYAAGYFDAWRFDAVTANPLLGRDSVTPFLSRSGHGAFLLARTSNPSATDLQDRVVQGEGVNAARSDLTTLSEAITAHATEWENVWPGAVGLVVGATYAEQLRRIRAIAPTLPILVPGVGAQGAELAPVVQAGVDSGGFGLLVNASRSITYSGDGADFAKRAAEAAQELRDAINVTRAASSSAIR